MLVLDGKIASAAVKASLLEQTNALKAAGKRTPHLAAILGRPTIELYCDSPRWKTEGYWSPNIHNLGDKGQPPSVEEVLSVINVFDQ